MPRPANAICGAYEFGSNAIDLALTQSVSNPSPRVGESVDFSFTLTNNGPENATRPGVIDFLPSNFTVVNPLPSACQQLLANVVGCPIENLASSASTTYTFRVTAITQGTVTNTGDSGSTLIDVNSNRNRANNSASVVLTVTAAGPDYSGHIQQPINANGSSTLTSKKGVVPVKFTLKADGVSTCTLPPATIKVSRLSGSVSRPIDESDYLHPSDSGSNFRITDCQYHYNVNAKSFGNGRYTVELLIGGTSEGIATFELKGGPRPPSRVGGIPQSRRRA